MADPQYTLLLVDDNPDNLDMLGRRLRKKGYKILSAASGREALQTMAKEPVDLVILDVMMPEMNGFEVAQILKQKTETSEIPIIFLTAQSISISQFDPGNTITANLMLFALYL